MIEAYCLKCKTKREMQSPQAVFTKRGAPATRGVCPVCGRTLYKLGETPAHAGLERPAPEARNSNHKRSGKLVIVESPAKARTVSRMLGRGYTVKASVGHVRDLLRSQLSVDVENDFEPKYRVPNEKREVVKELKAAAAKSEEVYLATDPDREGEAIAWHLTEAAEIEPERARRVVFHEITRPAIQEAFQHPRGIDHDLVDAQQARRVLDRLVGYGISPILWAKVRSRLSAGRVQSVAVRLIVDREREIQDFAPEEYWTIAAELRRHEPGPKKRQFVARLVKIGDGEPKLGSESEVRPHLEAMEKARYSVSQVKRGERRRRPSPPFTTSTLQQEASRRLGFTARRTMALAQQLYEGVDLGDGETTGLITYMRTDSTTVSAQAVQEAREFIQDRYGKEYLPQEPPVYKTRARRAQEAHEAIRSTSVANLPAEMKEWLSRDQYRLYLLIWQRFVASQMEAAVYNTITVDIEAVAGPETYRLRVSGSAIQFQGYLAVNEEARDEDAAPEEEADPVTLPDMQEGESLDLLRLLPERHFTAPPPRYTEASLVKVLEENGIGRPSTYAPILSTIQQRGYVVREDKRLTPTETGFVVNDLLVEYFADILDVGFTATMEDELDKIASGEMEWVPVIREFYGPFSRDLSEAERVMPQVNGGEPELAGRDCPVCGKPLVIRWGRYGKFIGCSDFPNCRHTEALLEKIGVICPLDGGELVRRTTRTGRTFYGCENYPACEFTSWKRPLPAPCPNCGGMLVASGGKLAVCLACGQKTSQYELPERGTEIATPIPVKPLEL